MSPARVELAEKVIACKCAAPKCKTVWIVGMLPQPLGAFAKVMKRHRYCPTCRTPKPLLAKVEELATLLPEDL